MARRLWVVAAMAAALTAPPAEAEPFVGEVRSARAVVQLAGRDAATWVLDLTLTSWTRPAAEPRYLLVVDLKRCTATRGKVNCGKAERYVSRPNADAASIDMELTRAELRTVFGGRPLELTWSVPPGPPYPAVVIDSDKFIRVERAARFGHGSAAGVVAGVACTGEATLRGAHGVHLAPDEPADRALRALPAPLRRAGRTGPRCLEPEAAP